jgi:hypothetical protein
VAYVFPVFRPAPGYGKRCATVALPHSNPKYSAVRKERNVSGPRDHTSSPTTTEKQRRGSGARLAHIEEEEAAGGRRARADSMPPGGRLLLLRAQLPHPPAAPRRGRRLAGGRGTTCAKQRRNPTGWKTASTTRRGAPPHHRTRIESNRGEGEGAPPLPASPVGHGRGDELPITTESRCLPSRGEGPPPAAARRTWG